MTPGAYLYEIATAGVVAFAVVTLAWLVSRGTLHRTDRVGAAALAVGFIAGYHVTTGGGWHPEHAVSFLPLVAAVPALLGPRIAARVAPDAPVPLAARAFVLLAAAGSGAALLATGRGQAGALALAVFAATLGITLGERLGDTTGEGGLTRPDRRPATWVLAALLVGLVPVLAA